MSQATLFPAQYSLVADYFPKERLAMPMSVLMVSLHVGQGLAYVFGGLAIGLVASHAPTILPVLEVTVQPWQVVFFLVGLPGVVLALFMYTVKEPVRRHAGSNEVVKQKAESMPVREVLHHLRQNKGAYLCHAVGFSLTTLTSYVVWGPSLFIRNYGWSAMRTGVLYGLAIIIAGTLGVLAGGRFAEWLAKNGYRDANMRLGVICSLAWFPTGVLYPLMPSGTWALILFVPSYFFSGAPWGAAAAALQQMTPPAMLGQATGLYRFTLYIIAAGLGPMLIALMNDYVFHSDQALKFSVAIVGSLGQIGAVLLLWRGLKYFRATLARLAA